MSQVIRCDNCAAIFEDVDDNVARALAGWFFIHDLDRSPVGHACSPACGAALLSKSARDLADAKAAADEEPF